ncbi:hypothetical protein [Sphingomonas sp. AX6]|uniref:hypothetical protein n=1 Tax=Sphingomonas sp. AX6 TaxID=2653171 RepID=UPI0012F2D776|nr:hypothetical protein [Sphingomonas sp. AX6]VXC88631.1 conserved hypothetical protein [Sphingomonas sp. AX6]
MSLFLFAALAAIQTPPIVEEVPEEIVVIGHRIRNIRASTRTNRKTGEKTCRIRRSSGDKAFDRIFCDIMLDCAKTATKIEEMTGCVRAGQPIMAQRMAASRPPPVR